MASGQKLTSLRARGPDIGQDAVAVGDRSERADFCGRVKRVTDPDPARAFDEGLDKLVCDGVLDEDARAGQALLAIIGEYSQERAVKRAFKIGALKNETG